MSVEVDLLRDGMCFAHFISTPGIFDFTPPRTLDGGIAQFGFLKATKSYVIQDDSFGLIGCGCRVESSEQEVHIFPHDGLKKRLMFVPDKIDVEVLQGEIDRVVMSEAGNRIELSLSDSTGVVREAELELRGVAKGRYLVRYGSSENRMMVSDALRLSLPITDAMQIRIERI